MAMHTERNVMFDVHDAQVFAACRVGERGVQSLHQAVVQPFVCFSCLLLHFISF